MKNSLLAMRIFFVSLVLGPIPVALVALAITSSLLPTIVLLFIGAGISIYVGMRSPILIGLALGARPADGGEARISVRRSLDRAWDTLRQARRQKGLQPEFVASPGSIRLMTFPSARGLVFPARSILPGQRVIFVSTGALAILSESALTDSLSRALIAMNSDTLPARCWASVLMHFLLKVVPGDAGEALLAFESSPVVRPIRSAVARHPHGGMSVARMLFFWVLSPWLSQLLHASRGGLPLEPSLVGLREAFAGNLARPGQAVESEKRANLDTRLMRHVPVAMDALVRGV